MLSGQPLLRANVPPIHRRKTGTSSTTGTAGTHHYRRNSNASVSGKPGKPDMLSRPVPWIVTESQVACQRSRLPVGNALLTRRVRIEGQPRANGLDRGRTYARNPSQIFGATEDGPLAGPLAELTAVGDNLPSPRWADSRQPGQACGRCVVRIDRVIDVQKRMARGWTYRTYGKSDACRYTKACKANEPNRFDHAAGPLVSAGGNAGRHRTPPCIASAPTA